MAKFVLASISLEELARLTHMNSREANESSWGGEAEPLEPLVQEQLRYLAMKLAVTRPTTLNEATLWSRAIYPLLELAETGKVRAWSEVPLAATDPFSDTEIAGIVDGVLAPEGLLAGVPGVPFLLVVEAKRGMDGVDPRPQLIAALVATLWGELSRRGHAEPVSSFGCFTVGDLWTFVRAEARVNPDEAARPRLSVQLSWSREYRERSEADGILRVLRHITLRDPAPG